MRARGYTLLVILLILVALGLLVVASLQAGFSARQGAIALRDDVNARAIAEAGLERTQAYLSNLVELDGDFDRALDPGLDTTCAIAGSLLTFGGTLTDDGLPTFTGAGVVSVTAGPAARPFRLVPHAGGAYLVRLDDNDDDAEPAAAFPNTTSNNSGGGCLEGPALGAAVQNPLRDRDKSAWLTVIGIYPGTDPATARAQKVLRVSVGPRPSPGVIAGGTFNLQTAAAKVCGDFGNVAATGSITDGCLCGAGCNGGPAYNQCNPGTSCTATAQGGACTSSNGGSSGTCSPAQQVPPPPPVFPWANSNAPISCTAPPCTPFYYLRWNDGVSRAEVLMWDYSVCPNPRAYARICFPGDLLPCGGCWTSVALAPVATPADVLMDEDLAVGSSLHALTPTSPGATNLVWRATNTGGPLYTTHVCSDSYSYPPGATGRGMTETPSVTFELRADGTAAPAVVLPHGLWFVEGNVRTQTETPPCASLPAGWKASLITTGDFVHTTDMLALRPAHPKGFVILAGRDFNTSGGNTKLYTCGESAAVMVHEQMQMGSNTHLQAQVVVENASTCSTTVNSSEAILLNGNATIDVSAEPPISFGPAAAILSWAESAY